jgi:hypothetical protein
MTLHDPQRPSAGAGAAAVLPAVAKAPVGLRQDIEAVGWSMLKVH